MTLPLAGARVKAADLLAIFPQNTDAWAPYTPAWTSSGTAPALGNGTLTGAYMKVGRDVRWRAKLTAGSTTTYGTGNYFISLPVAAVSISAMPLCGSTIIDASVGTRFSRQGHLWTVTTAIFASEGGTLVTNTSPMTWANTDTWDIEGSYEAAS